MTKPARPSLETTLFAAVRRAVERDRLVEPGQAVLVACSGGPDSMALLRLLHDGAAGVPLTLVAAHFDHRLRPASRLDRDLVREEAGRLGIRFVSGGGNVAARARRTRRNLEETARDMRYEFLRSAAERTGAARIAVGHTLDDQAETVLLRLLRGSGPSGLAGMPSRTPDGVIRPLLEVRRRDLHAWVRARRIPHREDESNRDVRFSRNRVRRELLPRLESGFGPGVAVRLARLAGLLRDEDAVLAEAARRAFARVARAEGGEVSLDARRLGRLPAGLARRVVREFVKRLKGSLLGIDAADVESVLALEEGGATTLPGDIMVRREGGRVSRRTAAAARRSPAARAWDGKAPGGFAWGDFALSFRTAPRRGLEPAYDDRRRAVIDAAKAKLPLEVRAPRAGDRYRPLGAPGRKPLGEVLRQARVPAGDRPGWPVVVSGGAIAWTPGAPVAEDVKVDRTTKRVVVVEAVRKR